MPPEIDWRQAKSLDLSLAEAVGKQVKEVFRIGNEHSRAAVDDPARSVLKSGTIVVLVRKCVTWDRCR